MNARFILIFIGAVALLAGCVDTVSGRKTGGVPLVKDSFGGEYERSVEQVYEASKEVLQYNGTLLNETILHGTNVVKTLQAKVKDRNVWVRVEPVDQKVTSVRVQARTPGGGTDLSLVHEIEKQIAVKLASR